MKRYWKKDKTFFFFSPKETYLIKVNDDVVVNDRTKVLLNIPFLKTFCIPKLGNKNRLYCKNVVCVVSDNV